MIDDSARSWRLYSAALLGNEIAATMIGSPTPSHYPDTKPTSPCPILLVLSYWLALVRNDKYQFDKSLV